MKIWIHYVWAYQLQSLWFHTNTMIQNLILMRLFAKKSFVYPFNPNLILIKCEEYNIYSIESLSEFWCNLTWKEYKSNVNITCKAWLVCPNRACMEPRAKSPAWNLPVLAAEDAVLVPIAPFPALTKEIAMKLWSRRHGIWSPHIWFYSTNSWTWCG
jgi:hypothetical protein